MKILSESDSADSESDRASASGSSTILEEEVALAGASGGEPERIIASAGVIASVLQFSGALAVAE